MITFIAGYVLICLLVYTGTIAYDDEWAAHHRPLVYDRWKAAGFRTQAILLAAIPVAGWIVALMTTDFFFYGFRWKARLYKEAREANQ